MFSMMTLATAELCGLIIVNRAWLAELHESIRQQSSLSTMIGQMRFIAASFAVVVNPAVASELSVQHQLK